MRRSDAARAAVWAALLLAAGPARADPPTPPPSAAGELDGLRRQTIAIARVAQQQEQAIAALEHQIALLGQDAAGRRRGLAESRAEQAHLLGALEFLARNLPNRYAAFSEPPLDRLRGKLLIDATVPVLRGEAAALSREIARIAALHQEIAERQHDLAGMQNRLARDRDRLAPLVARRRELAEKLLPADAEAAARLARIATAAKDIEDLLARADAAAERRNRALKADPTRPPQWRAFDPPQSALVMPVSGAISRRFGAADAAGDPSQGLSLAALAGAEVVAPFDGRVVYAGKFRDLGLVLIIRHGRLYHSLLAGLGRIDTSVGRWVLAGEPVGAMPDRSGGPLYFALRRDGRPVDPQPWLATRDARNGEQRVRQ